jgi:ABC-type tungstate transport system permease subunit
MRENLILYHKVLKEIVWNIRDNNIINNKIHIIINPKHHQVLKYHNSVALWTTIK